ncbi:hypothetical protein [Hyphomicrobium sp.]|uniref:hypothetical protein n=1 Tax=Hyphomicrobium sp. TaxID=82 RepID=UPI0025B87480|nr:hypothetical protein [Hyphomicrobium sp.]MCC7250938.1 hypothetical protein [Hyphomicrobium sp.]
MKVLVFLEHDIICRNFVMSGALAALPRAADVKYVFPDDGGKRMKLDPAALPLGAPFERLKIDSIRQQTWRWVLFADQLRLRPGEHERAIRNFRRQVLGWKAALLLTVAGLPVASSIFRRMVDRRLVEHPNREMDELLDRERPDVVLHPSVLESVFMNDLVAACKERKIPLVVAMNSWDNPSTKRAVVGKPDLLLVWGPQTYEHARRYMAQPEHQMEEFGAAQFDIFLDEPRVTREGYCREIGLDPAKRLVLFAGSNAQTDELSTLEAIDDAISSGRVRDVAVIYRPHPWGGGGRGGERLVAARWRNIVIDPAMREYIQGLTENRDRISLPDARDTHDLLSVVDTVISPLSTILLEAMLNGKTPVAFVPGDAVGSQPMLNNLPLRHFKEFLDLPSVRVARSVEELLQMLETALPSAKDRKNGEALKQAAGWFVRAFDRPWRDRIVDRLAAIAATSKAGRA